MEELMQQIAQEHADRLKTEYDNAFIKALKSHGYTFDSQLEMEDFVMRHVEAHISIDTDLYKVKGVPFFEVKKNNRINHSFNEDGELTLTADFWRYRIIEKQ